MLTGRGFDCFNVRFQSPRPEDADDRDHDDEKDDAGKKDQVVWKCVCHVFIFFLSVFIKSVF